jgi:TusA-related sulfurtransferase
MILAERVALGLASGLLPAEGALRTDAAPKEIDGGLEIAVTCTGRTLVVIQRMVPAWAQTMNGHRGSSTKAVPLPSGELLTVTATDPKEIQHIRAHALLAYW